MASNSRAFRQDFALRICWLLGVKPDGVERIDITIIAGQTPKISITKTIWEENEWRQLTDAFEAAAWKVKNECRDAGGAGDGCPGRKESDGHRSEPDLRR